MDPHISKERLTAFVDREVSDSEAASIQNHLRICEECAAFVNEMRSLFSSLSQLTPAPEEPELIGDTVQLLHAMHLQTHPATNRFTLQGLKDGFHVIAAGAIAAGLAIGFLFGAVASQGLLSSNSDIPYASVVIQDDDQTINDTYVAMIINDSRDNL